MTSCASPVFDFRSDTVTRPTEDMRHAMATAQVGDDYYRDDPTVKALEARMAEMFGKESAVFTTSGTQSNLVAVMAHCARGEAYIVGHLSHSYIRELGGAAMLGGVHPQVVPNQADGTMRLEDIETALYAPSILVAPVKLLALENTINGKILPLDYLAGVSAMARHHGLSLHLDGARVFNAAAASNVPVSEITQHFDTVSVCLSKGLGAPAGSILAGSHHVIEAARRHRQALGGGLRQAGILAAAGLYGLDHHIARLSDDHRRAKCLANALVKIPGVTPELPETNMVFAQIDAQISTSFSNHLRSCNILCTGTGSKQRWVTHLDIDDQVMEATIESLSTYQGAS